MPYYREKTLYRVDSTDRLLLSIFFGLQIEEEKKMARKRSIEVMVENVVIPPGMRNFKGKEGVYNREGERSFVMEVPYALAQEMIADGWNLKVSKQSDVDSEYEPTYLLNVDVSYRFRELAPYIVKITNGRHMELEEEDLSQLDGADIEKADLFLRGSEWEPGRIKAYLKELYVTVKPNALREKYGI